MAKTYVVLYGQRGVKDGFRSRKSAQDYAQKKANSMKKPVTIDRFTTYPKAKAGMTDWSQKHHATVNPKKEVAARVKRAVKRRAASKPKKRSKVFGFFQNAGKVSLVRRR